MKRFSQQGKTLLCFDFDETYFPHACTSEQLAHLRALENFLEERAHRLSTIWVTGSSVASLQEKAKRGDLRYWPHRIAANLGTEMYQVSEQGEWERDDAYTQGFPVDFAERVDRVVEECGLFDIRLERQANFGKSKWIRSYYYKGDDPQVIEQISERASVHAIQVNISQCNPRAGDPEGAYDVDFIPKGAGKASSVEYVSRRFGFALDQAYAFGDSGNDLEMLRTVRHGYVLQNGTSQAKHLHRRVTNQAYAAGILEVLRQSDFS